MNHLNRISLLDKLPSAYDVDPTLKRPVKRKKQERYNKTTSHNKGYREFIAWDGEGTSMGVLPKTDSHGDIFQSSFYPTHSYGDHLIDAMLCRPIDEEFWDEDYIAKPQPYVLLANSKGDRIVNKHGLPTIECFELLLDTKQRYPNSIFVGFGFNYDVNQILKDLPSTWLEGLHETNRCRWLGYRIHWLPGKMLTISHPWTKRSARIYDVFGFFQASFLVACEKYLGDVPELRQIKEGKEHRSAFTFKELDDFIIPYNDLELKLLVDVMNILRDDLAKVGITPGMWHGPGAVANEVLKKYEIPISRDVPKEVLNASQYAYAGGRFEHFLVGRYKGTVYEYDINSAYPAAATHLPDLTQGHWEHVQRYEPGSFGVWHIKYQSRQEHKGIQPEPLFCRSRDGFVSYPCQVEGWYWTPEASFCADSVTDGWVFRATSSERPFAFIQELYDQRRVFKAERNSAERALKLILNSIYGKLAQKIGWDPLEPPRWHQFEYAGYITSYCRAKIYEAIKLSPNDIISVETDAVFSTVPLDLPISNQLGDWEEKRYSEIVYIQSGFYYATDLDGEIICKYRGMDRDRSTMQPVGLPYRAVLDHLRDRTGHGNKSTPSLVSSTTRFIGLGVGLTSYRTWRSWETADRYISVDQGSGKSKRTHVGARCPDCQDNINMYDKPHRMTIGVEGGHSYARDLPWRPLLDPDVKWWELPDTFGEELFRWEA